MKNFRMIDEAFKCDNCGKDVPKLNYSARDHCPYCLYSKHLDIMPGDRKSDCKGLMKPVGIEKYRDKYKIIYVCEKCGQIHKNITATDDVFDKIIELSLIS